MKKIYLPLLIASCSLTNVHSQTILSFSVSPTNPTPSDTIKIITECVFPSGGCDGSANIVNVSGNVYSADAMHCMGVLTVICTDYDTLVIPPLAAGQYSLIFALSAGHGIPCTPGIVVDDIDTVNFNVEEITGISSIHNNNFQILPNPTNGKFIIKSNWEKESLVKIFSAQGKLVESFSLPKEETEAEHFLLAGIYFIRIEYSESNYFTKLLVGY